MSGVTLNTMPKGLKADAREAYKRNEWPLSADLWRTVLQSTEPDREALLKYAKSAVRAGRLGEFDEFVGVQGTKLAQFDDVASFVAVTLKDRPAEFTAFVNTLPPDSITSPLLATITKTLSSFGLAAHRSKDWSGSADCWLLIHRLGGRDSDLLVRLARSLVHAGRMAEFESFVAQNMDAISANPELRRTVAESIKLASGDTLLRLGEMFSRADAPADLAAQAHRALSSLGAAAYTAKDWQSSSDIWSLVASGPLRTPAVLLRLAKSLRRSGQNERLNRVVAEHTGDFIGSDELLTYAMESIRELDDNVLLKLGRTAFTSLEEPPRLLIERLVKEVLTRARQNPDIVMQAVEDRLLSQLRPLLALGFIAEHFSQNKSRLADDGSAPYHVAASALGEIGRAAPNPSVAEFQAAMEQAGEVNIRRIESALEAGPLTLLCSLFLHRQDAFAALMSFAVTQRHRAAVTMLLVELLASQDMEDFSACLRFASSNACGLAIDTAFRLAEPGVWLEAFSTHPETVIVAASAIQDEGLRSQAMALLDQSAAEAKLNVLKIAQRLGDAAATVRFVCALTSYAPEALRTLTARLKSKSIPASPAVDTLRVAFTAALQPASSSVDVNKLAELVRAARETEFWATPPVVRMRQTLQDRVSRNMVEPALREARQRPAAALQSLSEAILHRLQEFYKAGEFEQCERLARKLIDQGMHRGDYYRFAILSAGKQHRFEQGMHLAERALASLADDPVSTTWKLRCASAAGDYAIANDLLVKQLNSERTPIEIWAILADFLWMRGDLTGSHVAAKTAFELGSKPSKRLLLRTENIATEIGINLQMPAPDRVKAWMKERLNAIGEHVQGTLVKKVLAARPPVTAATQAQPPRRVAIVGMHMGFGGAPQKAIRLARTLADPRYGLEAVHFFCPEAGSGDTSSVARELEKHGVKVAVFSSQAQPAPKSPDAGKWLLPAIRKKRVDQLAGLLIEHGIDTVHSIGTNEIQIQTGLAAAIAGVRLCVLNPGMMRPTLYTKKDVSRDEARVYEAFYQSVANDPRYVIVNNSVRAALDYIDWLGLPMMDVGVLRNGIDIDPIQMSRSVARRQLGLDSHDKIVVIVGRIAHEKRPDLALDALQLASATSGKRLKFVFVGDGPLRDWLQEEAGRRGIADQIVVSGFVRDPRNYYEAADTSLLISEAEGLPNVVIEAQSFGLPVVTTDAGGAAEALMPGVSGIVVPTLDAGLIADAINQILHTADTAAMAKAARAHIHDHYAMDRMASVARRIYAGGRPAATEVWLDELKLFGAPAEWAGGAAGIAVSAQRLAEQGGLSSARRLLRWAIRQQPDALPLWEAIVRLDIRIARLPRSRLRYAGVVKRAAERGRISTDTASEVLAYLGIGPDESGIEADQPGSHAVTLKLTQRSWSQLAAMDAAALRPAARQAVELIAKLSAAGIDVLDGQSPFTAILQSAIARNAPERIADRIRRNADAYLWIGNLALGGGERQIMLLLQALQRQQPDRRVGLLIEEKMPAASAYVGAHRAIVTTEYDASGFRHPEDLTDRALRVVDETLGGNGMGRLRHHTAYFAEKAPTIVQVRGIAENAIVAATGAILAGVPRVIINVGTMLHSRQSDGSVSADAAHRANLEMLASLAALPQVRFIYNSVAAMRDWSTAMGLPLDNHNVIYNGFDGNELRGDLPDAALPAMNAVLDVRAKGGLVVLGVFRFHNVKRPLRWAEVAVRTMKARPDVHFAIIGNGRLFAEFQSMIAKADLQDRVIYFPPVSSGLAHLYGNADFLMHTAEIESAPNVVIEAQAFGLPVIATDVGGIRELVVPDKTARLRPWRGPESFNRLLLQSIDDSEFRAAARELGPATVAERFDLRRMAREFLSVYEQAAAAQSALVPEMN